MTSTIFLTLKFLIMNTINYIKIGIFAVLLIGLIIASSVSCNSYKKIATLKVENEELIIRLNSAKNDLNKAMESLQSLPKIETKTDTVIVNQTRTIEIVKSNNEFLEKISKDVSEIKLEIEKINEKLK